MGTPILERLRATPAGPRCVRALLWASTRGRSALQAEIAEVRQNDARHAEATREVAAESHAVAHVDRETLQLL